MYLQKMGSSGTGRFTDYPGSSRSTSSTGGTTGGSSGSDKCGEAFAAELEDVARGSYYGTKGSLPPNGHEFKVVHSKRLVAVDLEGFELGNLPTKYNYLAGCIGSGRAYIGVVTTTSISPLPRIYVDIAPI